MSFTKHTRSESTKILSAEQHDAVGTELQKVGKQSVTEMSEAERHALAKGLFGDSEAAE